MNFWNWYQLLINWYTYFAKKKMTTQTICMGEDKRREIMKTMIQVRLESSNNPKLHNLQVRNLYIDLCQFKKSYATRNKKTCILFCWLSTKSLKFFCYCIVWIIGAVWKRKQFWKLDQRKNQIVNLQMSSKFFIL